MNITAQTKICMVIGDPVGHSLGPQMYNPAYKALGIDNEYVYVGCNVKVEELEDFFKGVRAMHIRGISCTVPHKEHVRKFLDVIDETAQKIGAVNTIVNENGVLHGYNTDWLGVVTPLEKITSLENKTVALLGTGGAAKAVAYGVTKLGGQLAVFGRTFEKAEALVDTFGGDAYSFEALEKVSDMDIIFNATPVGLHPNENETPLPKEYIKSHHIVFDAVYAPHKTKFLSDAEKQGATIIYGTEMLLYQGMEQFKLYTGHDAPEDVLRTILKEHENV